MKIVIAEDDPVSRRLLEAMLTKWGYDVIAVSDGEEAWNVLQTPDAPRLAILDWMMPGMNGVQVCRAVRKQRAEPYTYILLLTGKTAKEDTIEGIDAGADDYITKPFNAEELKARLRAGRRIIDLQAELLSVREALREQATHDPLTGLPNRLLFSDRLTQSLAQARRRQQMLAVMFLDLDRFKIINDTLGHYVGDQLLTHVAARLKQMLRDVDTVARMGGDEFTVIINDLDSAEEVAVVAQRILGEFAAPFPLNSQQVFVSTSIGISLYPSDGADAEVLAKNADTAMYRAKEQGRNGYQFYTPELDTAAAERMALDSALRKALDHNEFVTYYQARVDLTNGKVLGAEALVRWQHPKLGLIPPVRFISLAEETGLMAPITERVIHTACAQNKAWQDAGLLPMDIAVNISTRHFGQKGLAEYLKSVLAETGLDPEYLSLELSENTLMHNPDTTASKLRKLKALGVKILIDDFGTGHSSLSYLKRFPIDAVKIDQSFVRDITTNPDNAAIAGAIVAMSHSLKLKVIAEGVETIEQLEFLRSLNCDEMQGYFVSRPAPADEFTHLLWEARRSAPNGLLHAA